MNSCFRANSSVRKIRDALYLLESASLIFAVYQAKVPQIQADATLAD
jgi:hypothetical protein